MLSAIKPKARTIALYLCIPVIWYVFSVFVPLITAMFYSFFEWKGGPNKTFIGIQNYITLFKDDVFWGAFVNNIYSDCLYHRANRPSIYYCTYGKF